MSVVVVIPVILVIPAMPGILSEIIGSAVHAAAASLDLRVADDTENMTAANSVTLCLDNAAEVVAGASFRQKMQFTNDQVTVEFSVDTDGQASVRTFGNKSEDKLRELGETMAKRIVQQYAYHRVVTEMRERNMNIVEEDIDEDGTVRMLVRIHLG